jgi:hypothetical protein
VVGGGGPAGALGGGFGGRQPPVAPGGAFPGALGGRLPQGLPPAGIPGLGGGGAPPGGATRTSASAVDQWVEQHGEKVPAASYGGSGTTSTLYYVSSAAGAG